jgi:hypothetical protein
VLNCRVPVRRMLGQDHSGFLEEAFSEIKSPREGVLPLIRIEINIGDVTLQSGVQGFWEDYESGAGARPLCRQRIREELEIES